MNVFQLKSIRSGSDLVLIHDISGLVLGGVVFLPLAVVIPVFLFVTPDLEMWIKGVVCLGLAVMDSAGAAIIKISRPTLFLNGTRRQVEFYLTGKRGQATAAVPADRIEKIVVQQEPESSYSFKPVLKDGSGFAMDAGLFRGLGKTQIHLAAQQVADWAKVPAYDAGNNPLPALPHTPG